MIAAFLFLESIMYLTIIYLSFLTIVKKYFAKTTVLSTTRDIRRSMNKVLNVYFLVYLWATSIPNLEINAGFSVCGSAGFMKAYNNNCSEKPIEYTIFGFVGLIFTVLTILTLIFFFRSYEFCDINILKRRYHWI